MAERTAAISVRVPPELKAAVQAAAKAEKRTLAQLVEIMLTEKFMAAPAKPKK